MTTASRQIEGLTRNSYLPVYHKVVVNSHSGMKVFHMITDAAASTTKGVQSAKFGPKWGSDFDIAKYGAH